MDRDRERQETEGATEAALVNAPQAGRERDSRGDRVIASGGGDRDAYASQLREQPGAMPHGVAALQSNLGNAFTMQVLDGADGSRGASTAKGPSVADFEKDQEAFRNRYDARTRALAEMGAELEGNPGLVAGDPYVDLKVTDPYLHANRLLSHTKTKIAELETAKDAQKVGSAAWNKLNKMQQELTQWGEILRADVDRYYELLKKRGFKTRPPESFP